MILADTSVWVEYLDRGKHVLSHLLESGNVLIHPFVIGELALGKLRNRHETLIELALLPSAAVADPSEVLLFLDRTKIFGRGIGYIDAHLLVAVKLTPNAALWTFDRRLHAVAAQLGLAMPEQ